MKFLIKSNTQIDVGSNFFPYILNVQLAFKTIFARAKFRKAFNKLINEYRQRGRGL